MLKYLRDNSSEVDTSYRRKLQVDDVTFNNAHRTHSAGFAVNSNITDYRYMYIIYARIQLAIHFLFVPTIPISCSNFNH